MQLKCGRAAAETMKEGANWRGLEDDAEDEEEHRRQEAAEKRAADAELDEPSGLEAAWARIKAEAEAKAEAAAEEVPPGPDEEEEAPVIPEIPETPPVIQPEIAEPVPEETEDEAVPEAAATEEAAAEEDDDTDEDEAPAPPPAEEAPPEVPTTETPPAEDDKPPEAEAPPVDVATEEAAAEEDDDTDEDKAPAPPPAETPPKPEEEPSLEPKPEELAEDSDEEDDDTDEDEAPAPPPAEEAPPEVPEEDEDEADQAADDENELRINHGRAEENQPKPEEEQDEQDEPEQPPAEQADEQPFRFHEAEEADQDSEDQTDQHEEQPEPAEEAVQEHEASHSAEQLGHMMLDTEKNESAGSYQPPAEAVATPEAAESSRVAEEKMRVESAPKGPLTGRHVETLNQAELMSLAAAINVDGNTLHHVYETRLIGERGLRRLVAEYQRGGDMREALKREILEHEIDFERDPVMRDFAAPDTSSSDAPADDDDPAFQRMLRHAGTDATYNEHADPSQTHTGQEPANRRNRGQPNRALDGALFLVISILIVLIALVYLVRR